MFGLTTANVTARKRELLFDLMNGEVVLYRRKLKRVDVVSYFNFLYYTSIVAVDVVQTTTKKPKMQL